MKALSEGSPVPSLKEKKGFHRPPQFPSLVGLSSLRQKEKKNIRKKQSAESDLKFTKRETKSATPIQSLTAPLGRHPTPPLFASERAGAEARIFGPPLNCVLPDISNKRVMGS